MQSFKPSSKAHPMICRVPSETVFVKQPSRLSAKPIKVADGSFISPCTRRSRSVRGERLPPLKSVTLSPYLFRIARPRSPQFFSGRFYRTDDAVQLVLVIFQRFLVLYIPADRFTESLIALLEDLTLRAIISLRKFHSLRSLSYPPQTGAASLTSPCFQAFRGRTAGCR